MKDRADLPMLAVKRPLLIGVLNLLIVIAGIAALMGVEVRELPNVDRPVVSVTASLPGTDLDTAASDVREAVSRTTRDLPERVEQVTVVKADQDAQPIMTLAVLSDSYDQASLTRLVENDIVPELLAAEGVASIEQFGTRARQMRVSVDPARLNRFGLTMTDVAAALRGPPSTCRSARSGRTRRNW
ncbi:efflux RND transporter permease subunit [Qipengyuania sp. GPGPB31]|uniref:efflux RND transporter permease subunit n=1 Tax=Qipengyuania sp. GPGPB31 TaxID=3023518 RepID=UPI0031343CEB